MELVLMELAVLDGLTAEMVLVLWVELLVLMEWRTLMGQVVQWLMLENQKIVDELGVERAGRKLGWYRAMVLQMLMVFGDELHVVELQQHL